MVDVMIPTSFHSTAQLSSHASPVNSKIRSSGQWLLGHDELVRSHEVRVVKCPAEWDNRKSSIHITWTSATVAPRRARNSHPLYTNKVGGTDSQPTIVWLSPDRGMAPGRAGRSNIPVLVKPVTPHHNVAGSKRSSQSHTTPLSGSRAGDQPGQARVAKRDRWTARTETQCRIPQRVDDRKRYRAVQLPRSDSGAWKSSCQLRKGASGPGMDSPKSPEVIVTPPSSKEAGLACGGCYPFRKAEGFQYEPPKLQSKGRKVNLKPPPLKLSPRTSPNSSLLNIPNYPEDSPEYRLSPGVLSPTSRLTLIQALTRPRSATDDPPFLSQSSENLTYPKKSFSYTIPLEPSNKRPPRPSISVGTTLQTDDPSECHEDTNSGGLHPQTLERVPRSRSFSREGEKGHKIPRVQVEGSSAKLVTSVSDQMVSSNALNMKFDLLIATLQKVAASVDVNSTGERAGDSDVSIATNTRCHAVQAKLPPTDRELSDPKVAPEKNSDVGCQVLSQRGTIPPRRLASSLRTVNSMCGSLERRKKSLTDNNKSKDHPKIPWKKRLFDSCPLDTLEHPKLPPNLPYDINSVSSEPSGNGSNMAHNRLLTLMEEELPRRTRSLPKSFLSERYGLVGLKSAFPSVLFPWRRQPSKEHVEILESHPPDPEKFPVKVDPQTEGGKEKSDQIETSPINPRRKLGISRTQRKIKTTSSPVFPERENFFPTETVRRPWSQVYSDHEAEKLFGPAVHGHCNNAPKQSTTRTSQEKDNQAFENVLQKFKKSLSHRFSRRPAKLEHTVIPAPPLTAVGVDVDGRRGGRLPGHSEEEHSLKYGSLGRKPARDRRRAPKQRKDFRNIKCNSGDSGDSGIHIDGTINQDSDDGGAAPIKPISSERNSLYKSISQPLGLNYLNGGHPPPGGRWRRSSTSDNAFTVKEDETSSEDDPELPHLGEDVMYAEALWNHVTYDEEELAFRAGDLLEVVQNKDPDWWFGAINGKCGWFPASFVRLRVSQEDTVEECLMRMENGTSNSQNSRRKLSVSLLSNDQVRSNIINEILTTERDFGKDLQHVIEGYLKQVRRHPEMFAVHQINNIFSNIEQINMFQKRFLASLESKYDVDRPHESCFGKCFLDNQKGFEIYSEYCNNHPRAVLELQTVYQDTRFCHFFEACRLMRGMINISLDGFLLTPVQKICKYPLQLAELLKYTRTDHPDHRDVETALATMRRVAHLINEKKRRMECLEKLASWQMKIEGWDGPDLLAQSSELIHQGDLTKLGVASTWGKETRLFLFDHQIILCKKDLLKRNTLVYKDRIDINYTTIEDLADGKDQQFSVTIKNGFKIRCHVRNKWYLFTCRSAEEKTEWMDSFRRERAYVTWDLNAGVKLSGKCREMAYNVALNKRNQPKKIKNRKHIKMDPSLTADILNSLDYNNDYHYIPASRGRRIDKWFPFTSRKRGSGRGNYL